jgi:hypothetical protein
MPTSNRKVRREGEKITKEVLASLAIPVWMISESSVDLLVPEAAYERSKRSMVFVLGFANQEAPLLMIDAVHVRDGTERVIGGDGQSAQLVVRKETVYGCEDEKWTRVDAADHPLFEQLIRIKRRRIERQEIGVASLSAILERSQTAATQVD